MPTPFTTINCVYAKITSQRDPHDEIHLAVRFLLSHNVRYRTLQQRYHISSKTLAKAAAGKKPLQNNREEIFCFLMAELDQLYIRNHSPETLMIITEVGRVHAGLRHNPQVWRLIS